MDKPRLIVRFTVALIAFIIGITSTLLVNYFRPRAPQPVRYELRYEMAQPAPHADRSCPYHDSTVQHAYVWRPEAPPPPEPPPQRPRVRAAR
jgi:hypothetical protein